MKSIFSSTRALTVSALFFSAFPSTLVVASEDKIVVTASKRDQVLSQIDAAITVKTGEELERAGVKKVSDLEKVFPGLVIRARGNRAYANISMRGVTSPDFYNPAVQVYVDGVPQDTAAMTQYLQNVERVELLRGPQGTLYGRNAHGGVINIVTRKVTDSPQGRLAATLANNLTQSEVFLAVPMGDSGFSADLSMLASKEDGDISDIAKNAHDIDESETVRGQFRLHYRSEDALSGTLSIGRESLDSHEEIYLRESMFDQRHYDSATQGEKSLLDREVDNYALNLDYQLENATISSTTSWQDRYMDRHLVGNNYPEQQETLAQEVRIAFEPQGRWNGVVGLFYQQADFQRDDPGFPGYYGPSVNHVDTTSQALFGEVTYQLSSELDLTFGARWSREKAEVNFNRTGLGGFNFQAADTFLDVSPKLAVGWQPTDSHRYYVSVSKGFKPGGFNRAVASVSDASAFDSEISTNIELGWSADWAQLGLALNSAIYYIDASDKQLYVGPLGTQVIRNVGDSQSYGLEADLQWQLSTATDLGFGFNWGRSTFDTAEDTVNSGNRLSYAPDFDLNLSLHHQVQQQWLPGQLDVSLIARYVDDLYFNEANSLKQDGYGLVDMAASLTTRQGVTIRFFVDNLTGKRYRTSSFMFGPNDVRSMISDGRMVGMTAAFEF